MWPPESPTQGRPYGFEGTRNLHRRREDAKNTIHHGDAKKLPGSATLPACSPFRDQARKMGALPGGRKSFLATFEGVRHLYGECAVEPYSPNNENFVFRQKAYWLGRRIPSDSTDSPGGLHE